jgi:hypothetical protein
MDGGTLQSNRGFWQAGQLFSLDNFRGKVRVGYNTHDPFLNLLRLRA